MLNFAVNSERCIACGLCAQECPADVIVVQEVPEITAEERCIKCLHCMAVCPTAAISILGHNPDTLEQVKIPEGTAWGVESLIKCRRSIRKYKDEDVDQSVIDALLETVWHAPTGVNSRQVLLTVTPTAKITKQIREEVYSRLQELVDAQKLPDSRSGKYLSWAAKSWKERGEDIIFRGAPHVLIASCLQETACPISDTHIALSYFDLLAQAHGLGTLWNGILRWAVKDMIPGLSAKLNIPEDHVIGNAMVFGKPAVKYPRITAPGKPNVNCISTWT